MEINMGSTDKKTAVLDLIERGKLTGKLSTQEITDALEELDFDLEQMEKLYESLESNSIEVIEDFTPDLDIDFTDENADRKSVV